MDIFKDSRKRPGGSNNDSTQINGEFSPHKPEEGSHSSHPPPPSSKMLRSVSVGTSSNEDSLSSSRNQSEEDDNEKQLKRRFSSWHNLALKWIAPNDNVEQAKEGEEITDHIVANDKSVSRIHRQKSTSVPDLPELEKSCSRKSEADLQKQVMEENGVAAKSEDGHTSALTDLHESRKVDDFLQPSILTRENSFTPSLSTLKTSSVYEPRGYSWKHDDENKRSKFVHPSHRNPTAIQAFYDTHFGSSAGWRSVTSIADDLHPLDSARSIWNRIGRSSSKKEKKHPRSTSQERMEENSRPPLTPLPQSQTKGTLLGWRAVPFSPGSFGMGSAPLPGQVQVKDENYKDAYEPELIPTVHRDAHAGKYFKNLRGNIVVLGGYRGSVLRDSETNQMLWVPLKVGVGLRRPTLELGLSQEDEDRSEDLVVADEMLAGIGNMVDTGKRLINRCSTKNTRVHNFGYDWRLSLGKSSQKLEEFLVRLYEESSDDPKMRKGAQVVAHSMGGLVALHALSRTKFPRIFESLVFASTPFLGTANILGPFQFGDAALFNDEICSPKATFSFRSSFYLLPVDSGKGKTDTSAGRCFEEEDGRPHDVDFLDPFTWNDLGLSPCLTAGTYKAYPSAKSEIRKNRGGESMSETTAESGSNPENRATNKASLPGGDIHLTSSKESNTNDRMVDGVLMAVKAGQSLANGQNDTAQALQPANQQIDTELRSGDTRIDREKDSWAYLERVSGTHKKVLDMAHNLRTDACGNKTVFRRVENIVRRGTLVQS